MKSRQSRTLDRGSVADAANGHETGENSYQIGKRHHSSRFSPNDMLDRLKQDPGTRTLGELLQERQWALQEIVGLTEQLGRLRSAVPAKHASGPIESPKEHQRQADALKSPNRLVRMKELRQLVGLGHSTIYKMMEEGRFPRSIHLSERSTAWRLADILAWQESLR
jgi:prophage regulatory protein